MRSALAAACLLGAATLVPPAAGVVTAQGTRIATTADTLLASAVFFHGRNVVLKQRLLVEGDLTRLADAPKPIYVFWRDRPSGDAGEVRGEFWDLGRLEARDSRFTAYDFTRLLETVNRGEWPARDQIYVLLAASLAPWQPPRAPTARAIALSPDDYVEREVKVIGRFKGRNLYGDLPIALGKGKWDFVLQSADGALWVTGVRPRGKGFDLDPSKRVDTGRWVEVTGVVARQGVTTYIDARQIALAAEPDEEPVEVKLPPPPPPPPPTVIFSAPVQDDTAVDRSAPVRIQFSRDLDPRSVRGRVKVSYVPPAGGAPPGAVPDFDVTYNDVARAIEIRFARPLEGFQQIRVDLLDGITAIDGQPLKPWTLTYATGSDLEFVASRTATNSRSDPRPPPPDRTHQHGGEHRDDDDAGRDDGERDERVLERDEAERDDECVLAQAQDPVGERFGARVGDRPRA